MMGVDEGRLVQQAAYELALAFGRFECVAGKLAGVAIDTLALREHGLELSVEVCARGQKTVFVIGDLTVLASCVILEEALGEVAHGRGDIRGGDVGLGLDGKQQLNSDMTGGGSAAMFGENSNEIEEAGHLQAPMGLDAVLDVLKRVRRIE